MSDHQQSREHNESSPRATTAQAAGLSKKQLRKRRQRKQILTMLALGAVALVVVAAVIGFSRWKSNQVETLPQDFRLTAVVNGVETELAPYLACELDDAQCEPGKPAELKVGKAKEFTLRVPAGIADHDWRLIKIFSDLGANGEEYFRGNQADEVTIKTTAEKTSRDGSKARLRLVEVHTLLVGLDADGEPTPYTTVWSIALT